ncbi:hypothetical protein Cst_c16490 [Thermoclostridium stercorarium subsp. stercorarium DSM 8532]|uniref:Uncharacterized protein n=1 Tax=Thermoclostridium stercorarium (strain ATCC 35414 / DSM 8532 / NCIMB 11754) TaxID=1121335 RepID=L7VSZ3_THES1|nr:hypothetical protein Cst_c16490 [Thermoclostridium stercorarium subsp. stercorarium DSM 8532]
MVRFKAGDEEEKIKNDNIYIPIWLDSKLVGSFSDKGGTGFTFQYG